METKRESCCLTEDRLTIYPPRTKLNQNKLLHRKRQQYTTTTTFLMSDKHTDKNIHHKRRNKRSLIHYCQSRDDIPFEHYYSGSWIHTVDILFIVTTIVALLSSTIGAQYLGIHDAFLNMETLETSVTVATSLGPVTGKTILLTDRALSGIPQRPNRNKIFESPRPFFSADEKIYKNVSVFLGIPYARPPLKESGLRFKLPQPVERWPTWPATTYRSSCPQPVKYTGIDKGIPETSEDCLYLNVFTPSVSILYFIWEFRKSSLIISLVLLIQCQNSSH